MMPIESSEKTILAPKTQIFPVFLTNIYRVKLLLYCSDV